MKLVYKGLPRDLQNVILIYRWSLYAGSIPWKIYPVTISSLYKQRSLYTGGLYISFDCNYLLWRPLIIHCCITTIMVWNNHTDTNYGWCHSFLSPPSPPPRGVGETLIYNVHIFLGVETKHRRTVRHYRSRQRHHYTLFPRILYGISPPVHDRHWLDVRCLE